MLSALSVGRRAVPVSLLLLWPVVFGDALAAQSRTTSAIRGAVVNAEGAAVPDADVQMRHTETGTQRGAVTNGEGRFGIPILQPGGPYELTVRVLGFAEEVRSGIMLQVGEVFDVRIVLQQEALDVEGITVEAERTEIFNPSQVGAVTRIDEGTLEALPLISRNFMDVAILSPLVKKTESGGFSIAGQNDRFNSILVDGVSNKDAFGLTSGGVPGGQAGAKVIPMDAVAQYEVLITPFDVRLSGFTGGVMNAVTRTGTNDTRVRGFAVHRAEALMGDLNLPTGPVDASGVDRTLVGLSVGGPIVRDNAHFFVAGEYEGRHQPPTGFNLLRDDPDLVRLSPASVEAFRSQLQPTFGLDAGRFDPYPLGQTLTNLFARVDWTMSERHRITVRNVFARASNDESPNRTPFRPYELSSNGVFRTSVSNTTSLQLFSDFGTKGANELDFNVQVSGDETRPAADWPQIEIDLISTVDGVSFQRGIRAGSQFFAQDNDLDQTTYRLTNSYTLPRDDNTLTFGVTGALYDIRQRFLPGVHGDWFFASMRDLEANAPQRYQRTVLADGEDPAVAFRIAEWGAYFQNEIDAGKGLTLRFGLRVDAPHVLDQPEHNPEVEELFGHKTSTVPRGALLLSPRWGFNWQGGDRLRTQVRAGAGLFVGQLPFAWLSNAFHYNGMRSHVQVCEGRRTDEPLSGNTVPEFGPEVRPETCLAGPPTEVRSVALFEEGFKYPQDFKVSAAVDQELSESVSMTVGALFHHSRNQVVIQNLNLGDAAGSLGPTLGYGGEERRFFGRATDKGFTPTWDHPEYGHVLLANNDGRDWSYSFTTELRGRLTETLRFQTGYSLARSFDRMSLTFVDMESNYGFHPISGHPNEVAVRVSDFDRPHKFVATIYGSPSERFPDTEISLLYTGQSGVPFSYVYDGDLNGDGFPGLGGAFDRTNDLIYVPNEATEIPSGFATIGLLSKALKSDDCLAANRGKIVQRNACRAPWQHRLDLRFAHSVRRGKTEVRFEADLINVLNAVNRNWGTIQSIQPTVALIEPVRRPCRSCDLYSQWSGAVLPKRGEDGGLQPTAPWSIVSPDSQWQAQFGVRVTFGERRR